MLSLRRSSPYLLPLTCLVGFLLATGRWGSYLGVPSESIFITDAGLVVTAIWWLSRHSRRLVRTRLRPLAPAFALVAWALVRFVVGGHYDLVAVRDVAPYVYVLVVLAACFSVTAYARTLLVVECALLVHLAWVWVALLAPEWAMDLPLLGGKVRVLEVRADFDGASLAVLTCLAAMRAGRRDQPTSVRVGAGAVAAASGYAILEMGSRAGLLALIVDIGVIAMLQLHVLRRIGRARALAAAALLVAAAAVVVPRTYVFDRLTADPTERTDASSGTLNARREAWRLVIEDAAENPVRLALGSGFGPDFLDRSGAAFAFEGYVDKGVRAPHNFVLNTLGRTGLVGVALLGWVVVWLGRAVVRLRSWPHASPGQGRFLTFTVLVLGALGVASLVGVILESPFGAVPFWWAAGFLLVGTAHRTKAQDAAGSTRSSVNAAPRASRPSP